jgi:hypothetical protein
MTLNHGHLIQWPHKEGPYSCKLLDQVMQQARFFFFSMKKNCGSLLEPKIVIYCALNQLKNPVVCYLDLKLHWTKQIELMNRRCSLAK